MKREDYAYAVASVRQQENELLKVETINKLIAAKTIEDVKAILVETGYISNSDDILVELSKKEKNCFSYLKEICPNENLLNFLVVKNDYHNIKAYLKSIVSKEEADKYFISPSIFDPTLLKDEQEVLRLPSYVQEAMSEGYNLLTKTLDGQLIDLYLDRLSIETLLKMSFNIDSEFCRDLAETQACLLNIKIAIRGMRTGKNGEFLEIALAKTNNLDKQKLMDYALKGEDALFEYIKKAGFEDGITAIKISDTAFEKWCDDLILKKASKAKLISFGIEPLVLYYYAMQNEIKNLRIIISSIAANEDVELIKERVRQVNV